MNFDIRPLEQDDRRQAADVINAAAAAYRGVIPEESDTDPYMPVEELHRESELMTFFGAYDGDTLLGVLAVQERDDVSLIRHLYVRPGVQGSGIGTALLTHGTEAAATETILVGTWRAAEWAIAFYETNGFENLGTDEELLSTYWDIPEHQLSASVVLQADRSRGSDETG
jgi:GNAT superfamily N-acetyltransferase